MHPVLYGMRRAEFCTFATSEALFGIIADTDIKALRFGVMTPQTAQWTALHKHGRAYSRSVVDRHSLYIEYFTHKYLNSYAL